MAAILTTIIAIVFVLLLFSLLASTIMELVAGYLSLRGKHLLFSITNMIGQAASINFTRHPFFQQLTIGSRERTRVAGASERFPAYINSGTFSAILMDILTMDTTEDVRLRIEQMEDGALKQLLLFLYRQAGGDFIQFKLKIEEWFNEVMDRASGAYKRQSQRWLFVIGLGLALTFNVDVINIYHNLSINATLANTVADAAGQFVYANPNLPTTPNLDNPDIDRARAQIGALINDNIDALESPLGLGWATVNWQDVGGEFWLYKIIGWLTTALSLSLGASFWFDVLKRLVNLRNAGPVPSSPTPSGISSVPMVPVGSTLTRKEAESVLESRSMRPAPRAATAPPDTMPTRDVPPAPLPDVPAPPRSPEKPGDSSGGSDRAPSDNDEAMG